MRARTGDALNTWGNMTAADLGRAPGLRNALISNMMDQCALTQTSSQPSCGISLMCPPGHEERLLRISLAAERALS